ncbi:hypothetical protein BDQ17DRAFT_1306225 [Cyathus striatus]|nr:hypothetical protein BDQ17DRAFT_1306225 [Cyathus striatus]
MSLKLTAVYRNARQALAFGRTAAKPVMYPLATLRPLGARGLATPRLKLSEAIIGDHEQIHVYADEYKRAKGNADAQERWGNQLTWAIARHSVGEEIVVYPLLQKYLGDTGAEMAETDRGEHQVVKERLYKLTELQPGSHEYDSEINKMMTAIRKHMDREETDDLPMLEAVLNEEDSINAARSFTRTKKFAPTRPHPMAPNTPPFETLAGLLAAPIDKLKDEFTKFPTEEMMEESKEHIH